MDDKERELRQRAIRDWMTTSTAVVEALAWGNGLAVLEALMEAEQQYRMAVDRPANGDLGELTALLDERYPPPDRVE